MIKLSPSKLNLFLECTLCFWLQEQEGVKRPRGIFPSLPSGMDLALKEYYDRFRGGLPPELKGKVDGKLLPDKELIKDFRNWRRFYFEEKDAKMHGALDECLIDGEFLIPLDFKTRGFDLKENTCDYYQNQLDCYSLMLEKNGYKQPGHAYLVYYIPLEVRDNGEVQFKIEVRKMMTDSKRAYKTYRDAIELIKGEKPEGKEDCEYCGYRG